MRRAGRARRERVRPARRGRGDVASCQRIALGGREAAGISFLGLATNGPAQGTAVVEYTDGSTQEVPVGFTDWTPGTAYRFGTSRW
ncbi:hypothetical protein [Streptomyces pseudogriseolus]|uniref:hypothetical protein n=1 Tax=Streptomyces pseudogriseolus TaxID=36817 RepID=UPI003FA216E3